MEGKFHKIELWDSRISNKKKLTVDAKELLNDKIKSDEFSYSFKIDKHFLSLFLINEEFELKIDNRSFSEIMNDERCGKLRKKKKNLENSNNANFGDSPNKIQKKEKIEQGDIDFDSRAFEFNDKIIKDKNINNKYNFKINPQKQGEEELDDDIIDDFDVEEIKKNLNQDYHYYNNGQYNIKENDTFNRKNMNNQRFFENNINYRNNNELPNNYQNNYIKENKNQYPIFNNNFNDIDQKTGYNQDAMINQPFNNKLYNNQQIQNQETNIINYNNINNYNLLEIFSNNNEKVNFNQNNNLLNFDIDRNINNFNNSNSVEENQNIFQNNDNMSFYNRIYQQNFNRKTPFD